MRRDLFFVYAVTLAGMAAPALLLLVLVRLLDPGAYGQLAAVQGVSIFLGVLADFGLFYSGSAAVAGSRDDPERLGAIATAGFFLRAVATAIAALSAYALLDSNPLLQGTGLLPIFGMLLTLAYGFSPAWLLWGRDRQKGLALAEHAPRILLFVLVLIAAAMGPLSPTRVLALQISAVVGVYAFLWTWAVRGLRLRRFKWDVLRGLAGDSLRLFLYRLFAAGFTNLNPYLLGLAVPANAVGGFAAVERVVRAGLALTEPLLRYHLPKIGRERGRRTRLFIELAIVSTGLYLVFLILGHRLLSVLFGQRLSAIPELGSVFALLSLIILFHPQGKARLLASVFSGGGTGLALAVQAFAFGVYALGALALYTSGRLGPLTLAGLLVAVEVLISLLAVWASRAQLSQDSVDVFQTDRQVGGREKG